MRRDPFLGLINIYGRNTVARVRSDWERPINTTAQIRLSRAGCSTTGQVRSGHGMLDNGMSPHAPIQVEPNRCLTWLLLLVRLLQGAVPAHGPLPRPGPTRQRLHRRDQRGLADSVTHAASSLLLCPAAPPHCASGPSPLLSLATHHVGGSRRAGAPLRNRWFGVWPAPLELFFDPAKSQSPSHAVARHMETPAASGLLRGSRAEHRTLSETLRCSRTGRGGRRRDLRRPLRRQPSVPAPVVRERLRRAGSHTPPTTRQQRHSRSRDP